MPLNGMLNKSGGKVRLTFKLEVDQLWISTKERTDKVTMSSIKSVVSEAIEGNEEYHVMVCFYIFLYISCFVVSTFHSVLLC